MTFDEISKEAQEKMILGYAKIFQQDISHSEVCKIVINHLKKYKVVNKDGSFPLPKQTDVSF
jgi:hypothetical protein